MKCPSCNGEGCYREDFGEGTVVEEPCYLCDKTGHLSLAQWFFFHYWTRWLTRDWWQYILAPRGEKWGRRYSDATWFEVILCRINGHPAGEVYYNPGGSEPDYHCKNCGDEI